MVVRGKREKFRLMFWFLVCVIVIIMVLLFIKIRKYRIRSRVGVKEIFWLEVGRFVW